MSGAPEIFATMVTMDGFTAAPAAAAVTADTIDAYVLVFEGRTCGKCGGSGRLPHFGHVSRGRCFGCEGAGGRYTKHGRTARARFDELCGQVLPVLREDIVVGDRVWDRHRAHGAWAPVTGIRVNPGGTRMFGGTEFSYPPSLVLEIDHPCGRVGVGAGMGQGYTVPRWDAAKVAGIVNEVAAMRGAQLALAGVAAPANP